MPSYAADAAAADPLPEDQPLLAELYAASVRSRIDRATLQAPRRSFALPTQAQLARRHDYVVFQPIELVEKLASIVPPPRIYTVRYHGVLAPRASCRRKVVPATNRPDNESKRGKGDDDDSCAHTPKRWTPWATLMKRVFAVDVLECPKCGGKMQILATIHPPEATTAILESLALLPRAPPLAPPVPRYRFASEPA